MKTYFKILAIILVLSVNAKAELILLSKCYMSDFKSSDSKNEETYKSYTDWKDKGGKDNSVTYTLNTNSQTITKGYINSDEEIDKYFKTYKIILPKVQKIQFDIEDISGNFVTATTTVVKDVTFDEKIIVSSTGALTLQKVPKKDVTMDYKIDFDLVNARVYSYTIKDSSNSEIKRKTLKKIFAPPPPSKDVSKAKKMTKEQFLTSVTLNLSKNNLNNPTEISKNLSKWEELFNEINKSLPDDLTTQNKKIEEKLNNEISKNVDDLIKNLDIDESLARLLILYSFYSIDDIKDSSIKDLTNITDINKALARRLIKRAREFHEKNMITSSYTEQCNRKN